MSSIWKRMRETEEEWERNWQSVCEFLDLKV